MGKREFTHFSQSKTRQDKQEKNKKKKKCSVGYCLCHWIKKKGDWVFACKHHITFLLKYVRNSIKSTIWLIDNVSFTKRGFIDHFTFDHFTLNAVMWFYRIAQWVTMQSKKKTFWERKAVSLFNYMSHDRTSRSNIYVSSHRRANGMAPKSLADSEKLSDLQDSHWPQITSDFSLCTFIELSLHFLK